MRRYLVALLVLGPVSELPAQLYDDLLLMRNRPTPFSTVLEARAGWLGSLADDEVPAIGLESDNGLDGYLFYRSEGFGSATGVLEAYAGRDGAYLGLANSDLVGSQTVSRIELNARYFPFYREGFYRDDNFVPTGRYEGDDWGASLSFGKAGGEELLFEAGLFYRSYSFDRNDDTDPNYVVPEDYDAWGPKFWIEHDTLVLDRDTGLPREGFILTLAVENEQNDSEGFFGVVGVNESRLPSSLWRARGHLEWYFPQGESSTLDLQVDGSWSDEEDRIYNYDAQSPQGHLWFDGEFGVGFDLGSGLHLRPFAAGQYLRIRNENGTASDNELFWGGGLDTVFAFGDNLALVAYYSYLTNQSRPPVSIDQDRFGEHRFFVGIEARLIAQQR